MASLKCSKCGHGIHYHDEPNGVEWVAFEDIIWDEITENESNGNDFDNRFKDCPRKYIRICEEILSVYTDAEFNLLENTYRLLDATEDSDWSAL